MSFFLLLACSSRTHIETPGARPNVLLVTIDTFRADRLGSGVTPALDRVAASGLRFTNARSVVPLTLPSHATILTGLLPPAHGVRENGVDVLDDRHGTVASLLKGAGYQTAAFVGAFVLDRRFGLARGFDTYDDHIRRDPAATDRLDAERPASDVVDRAIAWLDAQAATNPTSQTPNPFFLWIHLYDPHAPYTPPPAFRAAAKSAYDGEILFADAQIARVFGWLDTRSRRDRTVVIVAGDHGEGLGDHGEATHGMLLYDSTLRVPLIVSAPGRGPERRDAPVSLADIAPTIVRAAGLQAPPAMSGRDLLGEPPHERDLYAETEYPHVAGWSPLQALTDGRWKMIRCAASSELYELQADAAEQRDVSSVQGGTTRGMSARIDAIGAADGARRAAGAVSEQTREQLRSLGYVAGSPQTAATGNAPNPAAHVEAWNRFEEALTAAAARRSDAAPMLARLAREHPSATVFQTTYARVLKDSGNAAKALAIYRDAARRWPTDAILLHDLSVAARTAAVSASGATAHALMYEALRAEQAALAIEPDSPAARNGLGLIAIDERRPADAAREFERAARADPTNASYWANLGNARRALGDRTGAREAYEQATRVDSNAVDALNGLGTLLVESNRPGEAVDLFARALAAAPDFVEARLNLGIALQQSGQGSRAAEQYRRVLASLAHAREKDAATKLLASLGVRR